MSPSPGGLGHPLKFHPQLKTTDSGSPGEGRWREGHGQRVAPTSDLRAFSADGRWATQRSPSSPPTLGSERGLFGAWRHLVLMALLLGKGDLCCFLSSRWVCCSQNLQLRLVWVWPPVARHSPCRPRVAGGQRRFLRCVCKASVSSRPSQRDALCTRLTAPPAARRPAGGSGGAWLLPLPWPRPARRWCPAELSPGAVLPAAGGCGFLRSSQRSHLALGLHFTAGKMFHREETI